MKKKSLFYPSLFVAIFIATLILFYWFYKSPYFLVVDAWAKHNVILYILLLFLYKSVGVLFPPLPAGLVTMASIPFVGWKTAYIVDLLGSLFGGSIAYLLGKKYGYPILFKILGSELAEKISKIKIKKNREIEAVFTYRIALGSTILEAIYYGAGFLNIRFYNYLIGSFLSHLAVGIPSFYLVNSIFEGTNFALSIALTVIGIIFVVYSKGRYFE